jgi:uncharacterized protein (TIGR00369 family)
MDRLQRPYSGYAELIGYELTEHDRDFARVTLLVEPRHLNRLNVPHGGVLATLLDTAAGFAVAFADEPGKLRSAITLSMNVQYLGQAKQGDTLVVEGRRIGGGKTIAFASAEIKTQAGLSVARADAVFRFLDKAR